MYREAGMSNSQKRPAIRANRSPSGRPEAKRLPDRRAAQDQARGTASAPSCRRFRLAHSEVAERIRAFDWASTDSGPISDWSNDVQTAVTVCGYGIGAAGRIRRPGSIHAARGRKLARKCSLAPQHDGAQGDCDGPQHLTIKSKIPKARSERANYNWCANAPR